MNSANASVVSSSRACAASSALRSASMSLTRCIASGSWPSSACFMPGELGVEHLALQHLADRLVRLPGLVGVPVVVARAPGPRRRCRRGACRAPSRRAGRRRRPPGQLLALGGQRLVERGPDLVERAAEVAAALGRRAQLADPLGAARRGRRDRRGRAAAARAARRAGCRRPARPRRSRRGRRARRTAARAGRARRATGRTGSGRAGRRALVRRLWRSCVARLTGRRRPCGRRRCPCRCGGSGAAPRARTRPRPRPGRGWPSSS